MVGREAVGVGGRGRRGRFSPLAVLLGIGLAAAAAVPGGTRIRAADPDPVAVRLVDVAGLEAEIARHRGKVVVVDGWSTSCPPCVKEFPNLVALQARHGERIACISISLDYEGIDAPEDVLPPVEKFLAKVGAGSIVNLLCTEEADAAYKKLDLVSVPAVWVYGPDGALVRRFDEDDATKRLKRPFHYGDVGAEVERLLAR